MICPTHDSRIFGSFKGLKGRYAAAQLAGKCNSTPTGSSLSLMQVKSEEKESKGSQQSLSLV